MSKTAEEIEALKKDWMSDPSWDIEDTTGFEDHRAELVEWRADYERKAGKARASIIAKKRSRRRFYGHDRWWALVAGAISTHGAAGAIDEADQVLLKLEHEREHLDAANSETKP